MIGGQNVFINPADEIFNSGQKEAESVEVIETETIKTAGETKLVENALRQIDVKTKFARLKKAMRKRSVSIF